MSVISITAANVLKGGSSNIFRGTIAAGVTITQGQVIYRLANGNIGLADSNGVSPANSFEGVAVTAGSPGQPIDYVMSDIAFTSGGTLTSGDTIWLANTAGAITATYADIASGSTVIALGVVNTDGTLNLNPVVGGTK